MIIAAYDILKRMKTKSRMSKQKQVSRKSDKINIMEKSWTYKHI